MSSAVSQRNHRSVAAILEKDNFGSLPWLVKIPGLKRVDWLSRRTIKWCTAWLVRCGPPPRRIKAETSFVIRSANPGEIRGRPFRDGVPSRNGSLELRASQGPRAYARLLALTGTRNTTCDCGNSYGSSSNLCSIKNDEESNSDVGPLNAGIIASPATVEDHFSVSFCP
jgi:hypothetical protein